MGNSYNPLERTIARVLSKTPLIKKVIKHVYSKLVYLKSKKSYQFKSNFTIIEVGSSIDREKFFGYYDKSPSAACGLTIVHQTEQRTDQLPDSNCEIEISILDGNDNKLLGVGTRSFNWQQGSRTHWLDEEHFIFNDFDENTRKYISRIYSVITKDEVTRYDYPVQDSYKNQYYLSINYQRLMTLRPDYGYRNLPNLDYTQLLDTSNDGIWKVSLSNGDTELLYSIDDVKTVDDDGNFSDAIHKVNHVSISPSGDNFIFLHRYFFGQRRIDRLMLAKADGSSIKRLASYGMVSHCFWADEHTILGYLRGPNGKDAYWLIDIQTGDFTHFANGDLDKYGDGHPHVVGDWFITDTYPDKSRMQHLLLCNWKTGAFKEIGEFFHGFNYSGETRCDLHPRLSADGKSLFFDSVYSGKRKLYRIELNQ